MKILLADDNNIFKINCFCNNKPQVYKKTHLNKLIIKMGL